MLEFLLVFYGKLITSIFSSDMFSFITTLFLFTSGFSVLTMLRKI